MKTKILVDSNIFVYAYDANSSFHSKAVALLGDPDIDFGSIMISSCPNFKLNHDVIP